MDRWLNENRRCNLTAGTTIPKVETNMLNHKHQIIIIIASIAIEYPNDITILDAVKSC